MKTRRPSEELLNTLARHFWFGRLSVELQRDLLASAQLLTFEQNEWLYGTGDNPQGLFVILDGAAKFYVALPKGDDALVHVALSGEVFGHVAELGSGPRLATVIAAEHSTFFYIPETDMKRLTKQYPALWSSLANLLYDQVGGILQQFAHILTASTKAKLASKLLLLGHRDSRNRPITLSQQELAELIGVTRKTVNRLLVELAAEQTVEVHGRQIKIIDRPHLLLIAQGRQE